MKSLSLLIFAILFLARSAYATAQHPDILIYEGKEYALFTNPLEYYFEQHPERRPGMASTALWRGYIATFEFKDSMLVLKDISVPDYSNDTLVSIWSKIFVEDTPVVVNWYSGILVLPYGKLKNYVHMGYASTYSKYILISVVDGKMQEVRHYNDRKYEKFRKRQFEAFKKTEEYQKLVAELKANDPDTSDEFIEEFLQIYVVSYTSRFIDE